jgi:Flp pilus assembly protein TadG
MPEWRAGVSWGRRLRTEDGSVLVITAFGATMLMGCMALSIDAGRVLLAQRQMQAFADAAAMAGALEISTCGGTTNCTAMQDAAQAAAQEVGASSVTIVTQCGSTSGMTGLVVQLNNGPCALGTADPNHGSANYVEAVVGEQVNTIFGSVLGQDSFNVEARSEAGGGTPQYCDYVLNPTATNALLLNGSDKLIASCGIMVDSSASQAVLENGSGNTITSTQFSVVGNYLQNGTGNTISPNPQTGAASVSDPLASLATPTVGSCGSGSGSTWNGSASTAVIMSNATLNQGVYCGGIIINGSNFTVTLNPGTYIVEGNITINGSSDSVVGSGVTFYMTTGSLTLNGVEHVALSAPTSGTYEGILYFQSRTDSSQVTLNGDSTSSWQGVIYAKDANLTINGDNAAAYTDFVVNTLTDNGNNFAQGANYSSLTHGAPIKANSSPSMAE